HPEPGGPGDRRARGTAHRGGPAIRRGRRPGRSPRTTISPSRIARYLFHECRRYLRYSSTPQGLPDAEGGPEPPFDYGPVTQRDARYRVPAAAPGQVSGRGRAGRRPRRPGLPAGDRRVRWCADGGREPRGGRAGRAGGRPAEATAPDRSPAEVSRLARG